MKAVRTLLTLLAFVTTIQALTISGRPFSISASFRNLFKRRGGGGGRGGGGFRGGGSSGSSGRTAKLGAADSNAGGTTTPGTGIQPKLYPGGNTHYFGGAGIPYKAGSTSPKGIRPTYLAGGPAFFPGLWLYGAYVYSYPHPYTYHNLTTDKNETHPVECLCGRYLECSCNQVQANETKYINSVANNGSMSLLANVSGVETLVINGTLPNGTTAASPGTSFRHGLVGMSGWLMVVAGVIYSVCFF